MYEFKWSLINTLTKKCLEINKPTMTAGRNKEDDIVCLSTAVSRHHANFILMNKCLYVQDRGSINGTFVNDIKIKANTLHKLEDGDKIGLGICEKMLGESFQKYYIFQVSHYKLKLSGDITEQIFIIDSDDEDEENTINNLKQENQNNVGDQMELNIINNVHSMNGHTIDLPINKIVTELKSVQESTKDIDTKPTKCYIDSSRRLLAKEIKNNCLKPPETVETLNQQVPSCKKICTETSLRFKTELISNMDSTSPEECTKVIDICEKETNNDLLPQINENVLLKPKTELIPKTFIDQDTIIEIDDDNDSDNNEHLICSQLYANTSTNDNRNDVLHKDTILPDDIFSQIKKEVEELDRLTPRSNNRSPILIEVNDDDSSDDWFIEFLQESNAKEREEKEANNNNVNNDNDNKKETKGTKYSLPVIIEPHVEIKNKTRNLDKERTAKEMTPTKRKTSPLKKNVTKLTKKARLEVIAENFKNCNRNNHVDNSKRNEFKDMRECRKWKLHEIALKTPKTSNEKKSYGIETKRTNQPIPSTSNQALPTCKPIKGNAAHPNVILPQINTTDNVLTVLNWQTSWLEQQRNSKTAPNLTKEPVRPMMNEFRSYEDYNNNVIPLLTMEMWYSICKDFESENEKDKKNLITADIERYSTHYSSNYIEIECAHIFSKDDNSRLLKEEDLVLIQIPVEMDRKTVYKKLFGYVSRTKRSQYHSENRNGMSNITTIFYKLTFTIMVKCFPEKIIRERTSYIRFLTSITTHLRIFKSVKYLKHSPLCKFILRPNVDGYKLTAMEFDKITTQDLLNSAQEEIVLEASSICMRNKPGLYLINGPPGTGKTTVISNIIYQILYGNHRLSNNTCILLAAPSNAAIDELLLRITSKMRPRLQDSDRKRLKLVRVGPKEMINQEARCYSSQELSKKAVFKEFMQSKQNCDEEFVNEIDKYQKLLKQKKSKDFHAKLKEVIGNYESHIYSKHGLEYNGKIRNHESLLLNNANIICTTLSSCLRTSIEEAYKLCPNRNNCLIVDEATQSQEPETLIPLILGINKVILVGDPQQLPATTISLPAKELGYGQSLFSRLHSQLLKKHSTLTKMLKIQYRMHPEICKYPNRAFYDNSLENSMKYTNVLDAIKPYVVFNLKVDHNYVYQNDFEVNCVSNLIQALTRIIDKRLPYSIGIITPYNSQKNALHKKIKELSVNPLIHIVINTVDSFQGKEKEIIILSCVRTDPNNFLADEKRLNVALTRAKNALFIIGASSLFDKCTVFGKLKSDAEGRKLSYDLSGVPDPADFLNYIKRE